MPTVTVPYQCFPRQAEFHSAGEDEVLYGGAKGGGKSLALVMEALAYGLEHRGATLYLFRETYDDLEAMLIAQAKEYWPPELYHYNESKHVATLRGGSKVYFRYIDSYDDAKSYQGRSIDWIGIDEVTLHEERSVQVLLSCLRSAKGFPPRFRATCNPGGIGHAWVKRRYIEGTDYGKRVVTDPETGSRIRFIPAQVRDNLWIMRNDPAYVRRLENLPEAQKKAFLYGDWDVFEGQYFTEWDRRKHVIKPFAIPSTYETWRSLDWGYAKPYAYYEAAEDYDGNIYITREIYGCLEPNVGARQTPTEVAALIGKCPDWGVADPAIFAKGQDGGKSIAEQFMDAGVHWWPANNDRLNGWMEIRRRLKGDGTKPSLFIFETCRHLIRTLPLLIHDERKPEDLDTTQEDHAADSLRYLCMARIMAPDKPKPEEPPLPPALQTEDEEPGDGMEWFEL